MTRPRAVLVTPIEPSDRGNGLAMRAGVALDALRRDHAVEVVVAPAVPTVAPVDLVYVLRLHLASVGARWADRGARFVLDVDEDDELVHRRLADARRRRGDVEGAAEAERTARSCASEARRWLPRADLVIDTDVVPNPVPPRIDTAGTATPVDVLFVGNLSYEPNVIAVERLCGAIVPRLQAALGRLPLVAVVGSSPDRALRSAVEVSGATLVADPPSVTPWYERAAIAIVPIDAGGGTRLKVLEAFAHDVPVVATTIGIEGIPAVDGTHALVVDDDDGLAAACARLLTDQALARRLTRAARAIADDHHWDLVVDRLVGLLRTVPPPAPATVGPVAEGARGSNATPARAPELEVNEVADGFVVYQPSRDRVHYLNHTAALVLELCTGSNTAADIERALQSAYDLPHDPTDDVTSCLQRFADEGLVT